ncbi:hypothetical protein N865_10435 [Intrasporangium oryzae NRRL B-24470]|uniref:Uncharacterized protein n=1 Tax=Intrasporangium oryzae NRRL B-24470 TaxID=1386089 RepID=W9G856_9MICO|nr:hypothetical protein N865_10435 [Intrasporangium oryzae NRRL B-24470]
MAFGAVVTVLRFLVPVVATTVTASWAGAPVWTWLGIAVFLGSLEAYWMRLGSEPWMGRTVALPAVIDRDADLSSLLEFSRRWWRPRFYAPAAVAIALIVLLAGALVAPGEFRALHPGSLAMLALILFEFGESRSMRFLYFTLFARESRYPHRLSWLSPAQSPPVETMLGIWRQTAFVNGVGLALDFVLVIILLSPDSLTALLAPMAGFALVAVVFDTASLLSVRNSVQRVVRHTTDATLERLRERIERLEPQARQLTPAEAAQLQALLATYAAVRDAPTGPSGAQTLGHALTALAIPALTFLLAVMAEVYAERLLNQLLP